MAETKKVTFVPRLREKQKQKQKRKKKVDAHVYHARRRKDERENNQTKNVQQQWNQLQPQMTFRILCHLKPGKNICGKSGRYRLTQ